MSNTFVINPNTGRKVNVDILGRLVDVVYEMTDDADGHEYLR
jgi:hypothetical protein